MPFKKLLYVAFFVFLFNFLTYGEIPKVKFYPYGELTFCKGCGHFNRGYWNLKFRLENLSGKDLVVYGEKYDEEFDFINQIQYRNPDICEWQYSHGSSKKRVSWKQESIDKKKFILKAGQSIESVRGIDIYGNQIPRRFTAYIANKK